MARFGLQSIMGHSSIEITMNVYTHLSESDLLDSFEVIGRNRNFDFYSLTRIPEIVAPNDDTEELSEPDFTELPDDIE